MLGKTPSELREQLQTLEPAIARVSDRTPLFTDIEKVCDFLFDSYFCVKDFLVKQNQPPPVPSKPNFFRRLFGVGSNEPTELIPDPDEDFVAGLADRWHSLRDDLSVVCDANYFDWSDVSTEDKEYGWWILGRCRTNCYILGSRAQAFEWNEKTVGRTDSRQLTEFTSLAISMEQHVANTLDLERRSIHEIIGELEDADLVKEAGVAALRRFATARNRLVHEYCVKNVEDHRHILDAAGASLFAVGVKQRTPFIIKPFAPEFEAQLSFAVDADKLIQELVLEKFNGCHRLDEEKAYASIIYNQPIRSSYIEFASKRNTLVHGGKTMDSRQWIGFENEARSLAEMLQSFNPEYHISFGSGESHLFNRSMDNKHEDDYGWD